MKAKIDIDMVYLFWPITHMEAVPGAPGEGNRYSMGDWNYVWVG